MPDISQITLPSGSTYDLKDSYSRTEIENIKNTISGGVHYVGTTTSALTDGATTKPIVVNSKNYDQVKGDIVNNGAKEFIWDGTKWNEFGDLGAFKALAYKDSASGKFTPSGSVSKPTFTGTEGNVTVSGTPTGNVTISKGTGTANYTPEGTVSQPTFTGTSFTSSGSYKPEGTVTISKAASGTANYTPEGTVSTPTITVTPNTTTVNSITAVGELPEFTATVANENLTLSWDAGALPTKGANTTVATGIKSATSSQPTFTGTGAVLTGSFSGTSKSVSVSGTPTGTVSQPTFTGTGAELKGSFTGTSFNSTGKFTPAGDVSKPTFTGTQGTVTVS